MKYPKMKQEMGKEEIKKDPKIEYRKVIIISLTVLAIGLTQFGLVVTGRSWLIWQHPETLNLNGQDDIYIPGSFLLPNRYLITVNFYIPVLWTPDLEGNITFTHLSTGNNYTFSYSVAGYMVFKYVVHDVTSLALPTGRYHVVWFNNLNDYSYTLTTHGLLNFFPKEGVYPYLQENIALIISIFLMCALIIGALRRFHKGRRMYILRSADQGT